MKKQSQSNKTLEDKKNKKKTCTPVLFDKRMLTDNLLKKRQILLQYEKVKDIIYISLVLQCFQQGCLPHQWTRLSGKCPLCNLPVTRAGLPQIALHRRSGAPAALWGSCSSTHHRRISCRTRLPLLKSWLNQFILTINLDLTIKYSMSLQQQNHFLERQYSILWRKLSSFGSAYCLVKWRVKEKLMWQS